jgi:hypothetical protein
MDTGTNMEKPRICGYDCYTGEHIDREMTDEEYAQWQEEQANAPTIDPNLPSV